MALLVATAAIYLVNLTVNGYGNGYYAAAAQAGSTSWKAWFYGAQDGAASITVDKPPLSLWVMGLSVRLFGLSSASVLAPQALIGVATVGVLYATVRRAFGIAAGLIAGTVLALTPVAVLMFRYDNPDALLTLVLVLAGWATLRATQAGSLRYLALAGVFLGLAFLTKTLQVALVLPALGVAWLLAARASARLRAAGLAVVAAAATLTAGWWVAIVQLVPPARRPFIGGTVHNSFLELTVGLNGLSRITGQPPARAATHTPLLATPLPAPPPLPAAPKPPRHYLPGWEGVAHRWVDTWGGQAYWLVPAAVVLLVAGLWFTRRAPRTDLRRASYLMWGLWLAVSLVIFTQMRGQSHEYYLVALAPAIAALVGMGGTQAWSLRRTRPGATALLIAMLSTGVMSIGMLTVAPHYPLMMTVAIFAAAAAAAVILALNLNHAVPTRRALPLFVVAAAAAGLLGPLAFDASTVRQRHISSVPLAGPLTNTDPPGTPISITPGFGKGVTATPEVVELLNRDADSYTWVAAAVHSLNSSNLQLGAQHPVMPVGGFRGADPSPTPLEFKALVEQGRIHYFLPNGPLGYPVGGSGDSHAIAEWVVATYTPVAVGPVTFYDLTRPLAEPDTPR